MEITGVGKFDAEVCENLPINFTNQIQSFGYLIVLDNDLKIIQVSENFLKYFTITQEIFIQSSIDDYLEGDSWGEFKIRINNNKLKRSFLLDLVFKFNDTSKRFLTKIHFADNYLLLELEEIYDEKIRSFIGVYQEIKYYNSLLKATNDIDELCITAAEIVKTLSGYHRVMIYSFDKDWNGKVLGEAKSEGMDSFMGIHFPSSDIPQQVRKQYLKKGFRLIPDVDYHPQSLTPEINPVNNGYTDLSLCNLRSVARVHIEYLKNMGVQASMSVPIIMNNNLWGLIACHHCTAKNLSYEIRSALELLSNIISSQVSIKETEIHLSRRQDLSTSLNILIEQITKDNDFVGGLLSKEVNITNLLKLTGVAIFYENNFHYLGKTPSEPQIKDLIKWYKENYSGDIFFTEKLPLIFEPAKEYAAEASGIILLPLAIEQDYFIIGFREEIIQSIYWAGDPGHAKSLSGDVNSLYPRNSFALFKDKVSYNSAKWDEIEIEIAETLLRSILEVILKSQIMRRLIAEEDSYRLSEIAQKTSNAIATLNTSGNIDWVNDAFVKHIGIEFKEILGKSWKEIFNDSKEFQDIDSEFNHLIKFGREFTCEVNISKNNEYSYLSFNFSTIKALDEDVNKIIVVGTDITELKEKSSLLEIKNNELDKYAYVVSHDLQAPLKSVEGLVYILEDEIFKNLNEENKGYWNFIKESIQNMDSFISEILIEAKAGRKSEKVEINLNLLFEEVLLWINPPKDKVHFKVQEGLPIFFGNKNNLQQVLLNLISNAIKHGHKKNKLNIIEIGLKNEGNFLEIFVRDNGPGIIKADQGRIFEVFTTSGKSGGTGIGLSTVKNLVEISGGKIWIESEVGNGATFKFTWPIG